MNSQTSKKSCLILIDSDIVIRAFVEGKAFDELRKKFDLTFAYAKDTTSEKKYINVDLSTYVSDEVISCEIPRKRMGYWYFLFVAQALFVNRGTDNYNLIKHYKFYVELGKRNTTFIALFSQRFIFPIFKFLFKKVMGSHQPILEMIEEVNPDLVIYPTLLTGPFINDILPITKQKGIKCIFCMNSWDNPSSKAISVGEPDKLVVWGEQSKFESIRYLGISKDKIEIFGAAQFQIYRQESSLNKNELSKKFQVPPGRRIILYAGNGDSNDETIFLEKLDKAVTNKILPNCHIIYRPHPWRGKLRSGEKDFFACKWEHVSMDPHMEEFYKSTIKKPTGKFFMIEYEVTRDLLLLASGVVSARSTLLLEAMVNGVPILILYPHEIKSKDFSVDYVHFKRLTENKLIENCFDLEKLENQLRGLHAQILDKSYGTILKEIVSEFAIMDGDTYAIRLLKLAEELVNE